MSCLVILSLSNVQNNSSMAFCNSIANAAITYRTLADSFMTFYSKFDKYSCPLPCLIKSYTVNLQYFNKNAWYDVNAGNTF